MPTILRVGRSRFFFYSTDRIEPPHVHVEVGDGVAKFWLDPVRLAASRGMTRVSYLGCNGSSWIVGTFS